MDKLDQVGRWLWLGYCKSRPQAKTVWASLLYMNKQHTADVISTQSIPVNCAYRPGVINSFLLENKAANESSCLNSSPAASLNGVKLPCTSHIVSSHLREIYHEGLVSSHCLTLLSCYSFTPCCGLLSGEKSKLCSPKYDFSPPSPKIFDSAWQDWFLPDQCRHITGAEGHTGVTYWENLSAISLIPISNRISHVL